MVATISIIHFFMHHGFIFSVPWGVQSFRKNCIVESGLQFTNTWIVDGAIKDWMVISLSFKNLYIEMKKDAYL